MKGRIGRIWTSVLIVTTSAIAASFAQGKTVVPDLIRLVEGKGWKISNRALTAVEEDGKKAVRFDERMGDGIAWLEEIKFTNGTLECDLKGKDVLQRSFLGLAFRGIDEKTQDVVYCRPFNFRAADPSRRNHAVQYVSHPTYTWSKLREEKPEMYEKSVNPAPDPNAWFHLRIVVSRPTVSVYINDAKEPSLVVQELSDRTGGWVGLWVGNTSGGAFANLKITPDR